MLIESTDLSGSNELLVIDAGRLGDGLLTGLATEGFRVSVASSGEEGVSMAAARAPAAVILHSELPGISGLAALRVLSSMGTAPVLFLSGNHDEDEVVLALEMGAVDFLDVPVGVRECAARIWSAIRRSAVRTVTPFNPSGPAVRPTLQVVKAGPVEVDLTRREVLIRGERVHARPKEIDLLALLVSNATRVVSREAALRLVWTENVQDRGDSLDVHIRRIRSMVEEERSNPRHVITVRGYGHRFDP